jgi:hypothetical protein
MENPSAEVRPCDRLEKFLDHHVQLTFQTSTAAVVKMRLRFDERARSTCTRHLARHP